MRAMTFSNTPNSEWVVQRVRKPMLGRIRNVKMASSNTKYRLHLMTGPISSRSRIIRSISLYDLEATQTMEFRTWVQWNLAGDFSELPTVILPPQCWPTYDLAILVTRVSCW